MKAAQEIASKVKSRFDKGHPVGVAQRVILDALGIEADHATHADEIFTALGIGVQPVRVGRRSVPSVSRIDNSGGGLNIEGEGESWEHVPVDVDLSAIAEWMK